MPINAYVAIDSNCHTFLVDAMYAYKSPMDSAFEQKIALLRIYLYRNEILYTSETVKLEYKKITEILKRDRHDGISKVVLGDIPKFDYKVIEDRFNFYINFHKKENDCRILAESEIGDCQYLLTYDFDFLARLKDKTKSIQMKTPVEFWNELNIIKGSKSFRTPSTTNPLSKQTWWIW